MKPNAPKRKKHARAQGVAGRLENGKISHDQANRKHSQNIRPNAVPIAAFSPVCPRAATGHSPHLWRRRARSKHRPRTELGCSAGGNLIAVAVRHPKLRAMGVDVSGVQIAYGQQVLQSSGISNAELRQASIEEIDESWGTFDYIICHGVYSWVPPAVQRAQAQILSPARLRRAPAGQVSRRKAPRAL